MSVQIAPDIEARIREKVESGPYPDADAVLRDAIHLLEDRDRKHAWLLQALAEGEKGEGRELTQELLDELHERAMRRAQAGEQPSPDVCP